MENPNVNNTTSTNGGETKTILTPPVWKMDDKCANCGKEFMKILVPRHHCRNCGNSFCSNCISKKSTLPHFGYYNKVLICEDCYVRPNLMPEFNGRIILSDEQMKAINELKRIDRRADYETVIVKLRELIKQDIHIMSNVWVKNWIGRRWRNLFIVEACKIQSAIEVSSKKTMWPFMNSEDTRPVAQRISEYFFKGIGQNEWMYADVPLNGFGNEMNPKIRISKSRKSIKKFPPPNIPKSYEKTDLLFCPGLFNGLLPVRAFENVFPLMEEEYPGLKILRVDSHPVRGCEDNMADFERLFKNGEGRDSVGELCTNTFPKDNIVAIGYSKGMPDLLTYMVNHQEVVPRFKAIFSYAGAIGGSFLADGINDVVDSLVDEDKADSLFESLIKNMCPIVDFDKLSETLGSNYNRLDESSPSNAINSLTTEERAKFIHSNAEFFESDAWNSIPIFSITGSVTPKDVPYFQEKSTRELEKYDKNNDMQLITEQAQFPGDMNIHLAYINAHHWDLAFQPFPKSFLSTKLNHPFPKLASAKAMWLLCAELGLSE